MVQHFVLGAYRLVDRFERLDHVAGVFGGRGLSYG